jgi:hypothetical protein
VRTFSPLLAALVISAGCDGPPRAAHPSVAATNTPATADELPPASDNFTSDPSEAAVRGGVASSDAADVVARALHDRGDDAQGDGRLALLASWMGHRVAYRVKTDQKMIDALACRLGFLGPTPLVLAPMEISLRPFPRKLKPSQTVDLTATLAQRYTHGSLAVTFPNGGVRTWPFSGRELSTPIAFPNEGAFRLEIEGDGEAGPVVLANCPVYVGVDEPMPDAPEAVERAPAPPQTADAINERAVSLLNSARVEAHLPPVERDPRLDAIALAHSKDMAAGNYFAHVSPTAGTRSGVSERGSAEADGT